jgi:hypothetical protein
VALVAVAVQIPTHRSQVGQAGRVTRLLRLQAKEITAVLVLPERRLAAAAAAQVPQAQMRLQALVVMAATAWRRQSRERL